MPIWSTVSRVAGRAVISRVFTLGQAILVVVTVTTGPMKLSFTQTSRVTMRNVSNFFPMLKYGLYSPRLPNVIVPKPRASLFPFGS